MIRTGAFIVAGLALAVPSMAWGQTAAPQSDDKRYTFNRKELAGSLPIGIARMVELARAIADPPHVLLLDEPASGLDETEIARLQAENAAVKKELIARNLPLPGTVKPDAPAANPDEPRLQLPNDADLNKVMNFVEKVWRRLLDMIATVHKDVLKKQS